MFLGLGVKNRKARFFQVDYLIIVTAIKPWPLSSESVLLQWENGDHSSGSLTGVVQDNTINFKESFKLLVTLHQESSKKTNKFQKNFLEFYIYEPRKDKPAKNQLVGSAVINLADYGIIEDSVAISAPINSKKIPKNAVQPIIYVNIQSVYIDDCLSPKANLRKEVSSDRDGSGSVSEAVNEESADESIASFTDDEDGVSSHSSRKTTSSPLPTSKGSPGQNSQSDMNISKTVKSVKEKVSIGYTPVSNLTPASLKTSSTSKAVGIIKGDTVEETWSNRVGDGKARGHKKLNVEEAPTTNEIEKLPNYENIERKNTVHVSMEDYKDRTGEEAKQPQKSKLDNDFYGVKNQSLEGTSIFKLSQEAAKKQVKLRTNTLAPGKASVDMQGGSSSRANKLKHLKSVQLNYDNGKHNGFSNTLFNNKAKDKNVSEYAYSKTVVNGGESRTVVNGSESKTVVNGGESKTVVNGTENKIVANGGKNNIVANSHSHSNTELDSKIGMLKEELEEAAALESGLYSVVAEHGSSTHKVHAPARRLSRFYLHACKASSPSKRASAARAAISGLILVSKACGNDVTRLSFWLSNSIVLRAIVSQAIRKLNLPAGTGIKSNGGRKGADRISLASSKIGSLDEWEDPSTFAVALEKFEAWIFCRIIESLWWQTLTPHMQPAAAKGANAKKSTGKRHGLVDQDQGLFSIDLWNKAFKDTYERLCPVRAGGHECGCLPVMAKSVMEQLVSRLDVAMFNAILRESADEMPTDPISDPISDSKVLPIPAGRSSFGAGAQLKNAIGNWSRWLTDIFDIDDNDSPEGNASSSAEPGTSFKAFHLLNALSDLMMLPFEMLADKAARKEVCPMLGPAVVKGVLYNFVPDEFNPDPIPEAILEALDVEDLSSSEKESITSFPCIASPVHYSPPSAISLTNIVGDIGNPSPSRNKSTVLKKSYTSDDELDELDTAITSIFADSSPAMRIFDNKQKQGRKVVRYQLLREVWKDELV